MASSTPSPKEKSASMESFSPANISLYSSNAHTSPIASALWLKTFATALMRSFFLLPKSPAAAAIPSRTRSNAATMATGIMILSCPFFGVPVSCVISGLLTGISSNTLSLFLSSIPFSSFFISAGNESGIHLADTAPARVKNGCRLPAAAYNFM